MRVLIRTGRPLVESLEVHLSTVAQNYVRPCTLLIERNPKF